MKKIRYLSFGIGRKMLIRIILMTTLICTVTTLSGYLQYNYTIRKMYNDKGYAVGNIILDHLDGDQVARYARTWTADEKHAEITEYLKSVEKSSGAAFIYIGVPREDHTIRYLFDSSGTVSIGEVDRIEADFEETWTAFTEGKRPESHLVRNSKKYGYLTSSVLPVTDSQGHIAALLIVDIWMKDILTVLQSYILWMVVIALGIMAVFATIYWLYMKRHFVVPLIQIRENVTEFAAGETKEAIPLDHIRTNDEIQELAESVHGMEKDIVKYIDNIRTITAEKERIGAELNVATQIQADMLPRIFPPFPDRHEFDIYATMDPAKEVGGDFYDFFLLDQDHIGLVMADVSGKGMPAALFMVIAKTLIKNRAHIGGGPAEVLEYVNGQLCEGNDAELFVTVWFAILDLKTGKGLAVNAGHEHPTVRRAGGKYELVVYRHAPALAVMEGMKFKEHEFELHPGDSLFVYTDGVPEATNLQNELFGEERMMEALNRNPDADPETILRTVRQELDAFVAEAPQFDDITMLGFRFLYDR